MHTVSYNGYTKVIDLHPRVTSTHQICCVATWTAAPQKYKMYSDRTTDLAPSKDERQAPTSSVARSYT